jgi:cellulose synthase/poly-beta-1,6-N-acetylglucosamine synthase-like glycosyltransferase
MKISLVIPAYNEEKYVGKCLDSSLKNGGELFEIIVVNNASTDNTKNVVLSFASQYPKIRIVDEPQKGLTKARQRGLEEAEGDIVAYIDADGKMPAGWVEKINKYFEENNKVVCVSGPGVYYDQSFMGKIFAWIYWVILAYPAYFLIGYMVYGANFAARKSALVKIGGFDKNISFYGEDTDIARRLSKVGKVKFVLNLYVYNSARRIKNEGLVKTAIKYIINFISEVIMKKPATGEYKDIR